MNNRDERCKGDIVVVDIKQHKSQFKNSNITITQCQKNFADLPPPLNDAPDRIVSYPLSTPFARERVKRKLCPWLLEYCYSTV